MEEKRDIKNLLGTSYHDKEFLKKVLDRYKNRYIKMNIKGLLESMFVELFHTNVEQKIWHRDILKGKFSQGKFSIRGCRGRVSFLLEPTTNKV